MRRLLLDTNLLCLLVIGSIGRHAVSRHKRLRAYSNADYDLLANICERFRLITTPHILAETSNLIRQAPGEYRSLAGAVLARLLQALDESHVPAIEIIDHPEYLRLGLSDAGILSQMKADYVLLSADLDLYLAAGRAGQQAY